MAETWNPEDIEKGEELPELPSPVSEPQIAYVYDEEKLQAVQNEIGGAAHPLLNALPQQHNAAVQFFRHHFSLHSAPLPGRYRVFPGRRKPQAGQEAPWAG